MRKKLDMATDPATLRSLRTGQYQIPRVKGEGEGGVPSLGNTAVPFVSNRGWKLKGRGVPFAERAARSRPLASGGSSRPSSFTPTAAPPSLTRTDSQGARNLDQCRRGGGDQITLYLLATFSVKANASLFSLGAFDEEREKFAEMRSISCGMDN